MNDNGPHFINFVAQVPENQEIGTFVTSLSLYTRDLDGPGNQQPYTYTLASGSYIGYQYFEINTHNGDVTTKSVLDREDISEFVVPIIVEDGGTPTMSSTLSFTVTVLDVNDNAPTPRYLTAFVSLYEGRKPMNAIADVRPADSDINGTYVCTLITANPIFSINPSSCDLIMNGHQTAPVTYSLEVEGSDGSGNPAVIYEVTVKVSQFDNKTLEHSIIIQISDMTANTFLEMAYTNFVHSVQKLFGSNDLVSLYGVSEQDDGTLLLLLAVKRESNYYNSDIVRGKIITAKTEIELDTGLFIMTVDYSDCSSSFCQNNGECISLVIVSAANQIADSLTQSLSSPSLGLTSYCVCLPQFTGPNCGQEASQCGDTYCQNGGDCVNSGNVNTCQCPDTWTGRSCESDLNECDNNVCKNEARCENLKGSFICHCRDGFSGVYCEEGFDFCQDSPCQRGSCLNTDSGFICKCPYSFWGNRCQHSSLGFGEGSFMEFARLTELNNEIEVIFATEKKNSLLLYNPSSDVSVSEFIALEILDGTLRFSVALGGGKPSRITIDKQVADGNWYKVKVNRNRDVSFIINFCFPCFFFATEQICHCKFHYKLREYDQEMPQSHIETNPQHSEEETQNTNSHMTSRRQSK